MYIPMFIDSFLQNVTINVKRDQVTHQLTFGQGKSYADNISSQIIHDADCRPTCSWKLKYLGSFMFGSMDMKKMNLSVC